MLSDTPTPEAQQVINAAPIAAQWSDFAKFAAPIVLALLQAWLAAGAPVAPPPVSALAAARPGPESEPLESWSEQSAATLPVAADSLLTEDRKTAMLFSSGQTGQGCLSAALDYLEEMAVALDARRATGKLISVASVFCLVRSGHRCLPRFRNGSWTLTGANPCSRSRLNCRTPCWER